MLDTLLVTLAPHRNTGTITKTLPFKNNQPTRNNAPSSLTAPSSLRTYTHSYTQSTHQLVHVQNYSLLTDLS